VTRRPIDSSLVLLLLLCLVALPIAAQTTPPKTALMNNSDVSQLCGRLAELMEAEGVAIPGLDRAAAPVTGAVHQNCVQLQLQPARASHTYSLLANLRAYLALVDALPKPFPFPEAGERQLTELRNDAARLDTHFRALAASLDDRLVSPDPANVERYAEANRRIAAPNAAHPRVVFFGDSITDFWRLNEYFPDKDYINRGIAGQTTGQMLQRFMSDVVALRPQAVLILAGTNDLARGVSPAAIENNYLALATLASARGMKLIFASVTPVSDYHKDQNPANERTPGRPPQQIRELNDWLRSYCGKQNCAYVDYFTGLVDTNGQLTADMGDDGLHPNSKGYRVMAPLAAAAIQKAVGAQRPVAPAAPPAEVGKSISDETKPKGR
jgi:lysophospholipase L1-like esterase